MILNFDEYPSLSLLPATENDIYELLRVRPDVSSHPMNENVWEYNSICDVVNGSFRVEVLLRFSRVNGHVWVLIDARRIYAEDGSDDFLVLSITEQTVPPSSINSGIQISSAIPAIDGLVGDPSCIYSAKSPYLRCAINPSGPCDGCPDYEN